VASSSPAPILNAASRADALCRLRLLHIEERLNLAPLDDNGGPTETHALLPGSGAIDVIPEAECLDAEGELLTIDQRGEPGPGGTMCDVGSFERQPEDP
jgi:hypothetical protein